MMQNVLKLKRQRMLEEQRKRQKQQKRTPTAKNTVQKDKTKREIEDSYIEQVNIVKFFVKSSFLDSNTLVFADNLLVK